MKKNEDIADFRETKKAQSEKTNLFRELRGWILTILAAVLAALFLKQYVIINVNVPTGSMENTILPGDVLLGFRLAYKFSEPERGDIIIFKNPDDAEEKLIKRLIGLPGEHVVIEDAQVYIDGVKLEEPYLKEEWVTANSAMQFDVPEGYYLFFGDNRNSSKDARYWENTYVPGEDILGKAIAIYYPFDRIGTLKAPFAND